MLLVLLGPVLLVLLAMLLLLLMFRLVLVLLLVLVLVVNHQMWCLYLRGRSNFLLVL